MLATPTGSLEKEALHIQSTGERGGVLGVPSLRGQGSGGQEGRMTCGEGGRV